MFAYLESLLSYEGRLSSYEYGYSYERSSEGDGYI